MIALLRKLFAPKPVRPKVYWPGPERVLTLADALMPNLVIEADEKGRLFCMCPQCIGSRPDCGVQQLWVGPTELMGAVTGQLCDYAGVPPEQHGGKQTWRDGLSP